MYVFVYGTLTEPARVAAVVDSYVFVGPAVCEGLRAVEGEYPTLVPGGRVAGRLLRTEEVSKLDAYEGVEDGPYVRVSLPYRGSDADGGPNPDPVAAYVGDPSALGVDAGEASVGSWRRRRHGVEASETSVGSGRRHRPGVEADVSWPGDGTFARRVRRYLASEDVFVEPADDRTTGV